MSDLSELAIRECFQAGEDNGFSNGLKPEGRGKMVTGRDLRRGIVKLPRCRQAPRKGEPVRTKIPMVFRGDVDGISSDDPFENAVRLEEEERRANEEERRVYYVRRLRAYIVEPRKEETTAQLRALFYALNKTDGGLDVWLYGRLIEVYPVCYFHTKK